MPNLQDAFWSTSRHLQWEKCSRLLCTLTSSQLLEMQEMIHKIVQNILQHPGEAKFLRLRCQSEALKQRVLHKNGGLDILRAFGFVVESVHPDEDKIEDAQKFLVFPDDAASLRILPSCLEWLNDTIDTALAFIQAKADAAEFHSGGEGDDEEEDEEEGEREGGEVGAMDGIPAQALVSIELPTRKRVVGGFMLSDTVYHVRRFAASYFTVHRLEDVELRLPTDLQFDLSAYRDRDIVDGGEAQDVDEAARWPTMEDLGWFPRIRILAFSKTARAQEVQYASAHGAAAATDSGGTDASNAFIFGEAHLQRAQRQAATQRQMAQRERKQSQQSVKRRQQEEQQQRERTLQQFHDDRTRVSNRKAP